MEIRTRMAYINMVDAAGSWRSSRKLAERKLSEARFNAAAAIQLKRMDRFFEMISEFF